MKKALLLSGTIFIAALTSCNQPGGRTREDFNNNWKFHLGDAGGAELPEYADSSWRDLDLPHDWSIEGEFSEQHPASPGGGALPGGTGWYRKSFRVPATARAKKIYIDFDGVYRNSEVWINGQYLGKRPNGYISFRYELTPYLKFGKAENTIAVKVDNSQQPNSRWYSGSGIYRNVWLTTVNDIHVEHWGTFVTTPEVSTGTATVLVSTKIVNKSPGSVSLEIKTLLYDKDSSQVAGSSGTLELSAGASGEFTDKLVVSEPKLWSVTDPNLYDVVTQVYHGKQLTDEYHTTVGIRYFSFDAEKGFSLNGNPMKIYGVCNHHDLGALGAAVNIRAIERQLELLKDMGCNGIRTSHNPPAPELLDLCDRMGFLVIDEAFDMWKKPKNKFDYHLDWDEWHVRDMQDQIQRDRNHPSVILWSIGNEVPEQYLRPAGPNTPADSSGSTIARELSGIVRALDPTRPITFGADQVQGKFNAVIQSGAIDIIGYNYRHPFWKDVHAKWGLKPFMATESASAFESRGDYTMPSDKVLRAGMDKQNLKDDYTASSYDNFSAIWASTHEESLKEFFRLDFMAGTFVWTGWDYLGEPTPYWWPARSSYFGIIDLAGFPKDAYYLYQSVWTDKPVLHILPHWNWNTGDVIDVWAYYNNADEVELFLNGRSLGTRSKKGDDLHVMWKVNFEPGTLKAVSRKNGEAVLTREVKTAGMPAKIELSADRKTLKKDSRDLSFITVKITDARGVVVPDAADLVKFSISGEGILAGVDNGFQASHESFKADFRKAYNGLCLVIVQSGESSGQIKLSALAEGLEPTSLELKVE
jgi:beta-galactosidase